MSDATKDLFERYHACWAERDPDRIAALHTPDSVFHLHSGAHPRTVGPRSAPPRRRPSPSFPI